MVARSRQIQDLTVSPRRASTREAPQRGIDAQTRAGHASGQRFVGEAVAAAGGVT
jgi:hypothetical protein